MARNRLALVPDALSDVARYPLDPAFEVVYRANLLESEGRHDDAMQAWGELLPTAAGLIYARRAFGRDASSAVGSEQTPSRIAEGNSGTPVLRHDPDAEVGSGFAESQVIEAHPSPGEKVAPSLEKIHDLMITFGRRALRNSRGDYTASEANFNSYAGALNSRLEAAGSPYRIELQPAAVPDEGRVPNFINLFRGNRPDSSLIVDSQGAPRLFAYPGSRRLDAGVIDLNATPNEHGLRPLLSGYDISLDQRKPPDRGLLSGGFRRYSDLRY